MGLNTSIEWCHHTFNSWIGCVAVSPACDNCYAESESKRRGWAKWGKDEPRHFTSEQYWKAPLKWNRQAEGRERVFCGSLCDVMEAKTGLQSQRERLYELIDRTPNLDWLLLTKRPQNFRRFLPAEWLKSPRPNVWGMTTVESNAYRWRIDELGQIPFVVRGLSCEPLLEDMFIQPEIYNNRIDWVICGGESGRGARPMKVEWVRSLQRQCEHDGRTAFFFKQWGEHSDGLVKIGKKAAGRLLDGRTWDQLPEVRSVDNARHPISYLQASEVSK